MLFMHVTGNNNQLRRICAIQFNNNSIKFSLKRKLYSQIDFNFKSLLFRY